MTHFRLMIGAALLGLAAGAHAAPTNDVARPTNPQELGLSLKTLAPEGSTAIVMLISVGLTVVTRRNRRSVRSVPA